MLACLSGQFAKYIGVRHALAVSSGRYALELILRALELEKRAEVIIPAYTLKELVPIIQGLGLKAVAADIDPHTFNLSQSSISEKLEGTHGWFTDKFFIAEGYDKTVGCYDDDIRKNIWPNDCWERIGKRILKEF